MEIPLLDRTTEKIQVQRELERKAGGVTSYHNVREKNVRIPQ